MVKMETNVPHGELIFIDPFRGTLIMKKNEKTVLAYNHGILHTWQREKQVGYYVFMFKNTYRVINRLEPSVAGGTSLWRRMNAWECAEAVS